MGQIIREARKNERVSRKELADRIGVSKSHIAKIERGLVDTDAGMFFRIIDSLGLRVEIVKPLYWM
jgi:transcriptional regulator with XRE-family HTH domain